MEKAKWQSVTVSISVDWAKVSKLKVKDSSTADPDYPE